MEPDPFVIMRMDLNAPWLWLRIQPSQDFFFPGLYCSCITLLIYIVFIKISFLALEHRFCPILIFLQTNMAVNSWGIQK